MHPFTTTHATTAALTKIERSAKLKEAVEGIALQKPPLPVACKVLTQDNLAK